MVKKLSNLDFDGFGRFGLFLTESIHTYESLSLFFETVDKIAIKFVCFHEFRFLEIFNVHVLWFCLLEQFHEFRVSLFGFFLVDLEKTHFGGLWTSELFIGLRAEKPIGGLAFLKRVFWTEFKVKRCFIFERFEHGEDWKVRTKSNNFFYYMSKLFFFAIWCKNLK